MAHPSRKPRVPGVRRFGKPVVVASIAVLAAAAGSGARTTDDDGARARAVSVAARAHRDRPPQPACAIDVRPGASLQDAIDRAPEGVAICLAPGRHPGPVRIAHRITLWGPPEAVIASAGAGTTVQVTGAGARLLGFTVDGSGGRFDTLDAAIHVQTTDVLVQGIGIRRAVFGILVEQSKRVTLRDNDVLGTEEGPLGLRGDPIRLWEAHDCVVENNRVIAGRDVVVWYSTHNRIVRNTVEGGRYGTHLMYSHENEIRGNRYERNVVGVFLMYSRDVTVADNVLFHSSGAGGMGLGLKESGNVRVEGNRFVHDTLGIYLDNSPLVRGDHNVFERNLIAMSDAGIVFHGTAAGNTLAFNALRNNTDQVRVEGNGDATRCEWRGNYYDDYAGYDLDGDGRGDVAYESRSLASDLLDQHPDLQLLRGTPALGLVDAIADIAPLFAPRTLLVDAHPTLAPPAWADLSRSSDRSAP